MSHVIRSSEPEIASFLLNRSATREVSRARLGLFAKLAMLVGVILASAAIFVSVEAVEICSAALKANFCP